MIKKLVLRREVIHQINIVATPIATNSSQAKHCSCEQHCEQIKPQ